jgi:hypothetical protein
MENHDGDSTPSTENLETMIQNALDVKKKEIEREIADFKAAKEKEVIILEQRLRAADEETVKQECSQHDSQHKKPNLISENSGRLGQQPDSSAVSREGARPALDFIVEGSLANLSNQDRPTGIVNVNVDSGSESEGTSNNSGAAESHDRELEFQGLFTPSYLPLLDGSNQIQRGWPSKPSLKISIQTKEYRSSLRNSVSTFSSSATFPPSTFISPSSAPTNRNLSASVPREQAPPHGRATSGADATVACLRSSLRDPKQPRSPKRVLFAIDNTVVSPSTSPESQRRSIAPQIQVPGIDNVPRGFENEAAGKGTLSHIGESWDDSSSTAFVKNRLTLPATNKKSNLYPVNPSRGSFGTGNIQLQAGVDGPGWVGFDDDLFAFDEDLNLKEVTNSEKNEGSAGSEEEDEGSKGEPTPSSPHAGSLPIEIKWPTKRNGRR